MDNNSDETLSQIKELNEKKNKLEKKNIEYEKIIIDNKNEVKQIEIKLWKMCKHNWVIDPACSDDDLCKRYCSICNIRNCYIF